MGLREWFKRTPRPEPQIGERWVKGDPWENGVLIVDRRPGWVRLSYIMDDGSVSDLRHTWELRVFRHIWTRRLDA